MKNPPQLAPGGSVGNLTLQITECPLDPPPMSPENSLINHAINNQILFQAYEAGTRTQKNTSPSAWNQSNSR